MIRSTTPIPAVVERVERCAVASCQARPTVYWRVNGVLEDSAPLCAYHRGQVLGVCVVSGCGEQVAGGLQLVPGLGLRLCTLHHEQLAAGWDQASEQALHVAATVLWPTLPSAQRCQLEQALATKVAIELHPAAAP